MDTNFKDRYIAWLHDTINQRQIRDGLYSITFPYLDRNNDFIEIFIVVNPDGTIRLTDDGETINELDFSGMDLFRSNRRKRLLEQIVMSHGVQLGDDRALYVDCDIDSLPAKKHLLAQCMIKISDMYQMSKSNVQSLFVEDVKDFLSSNDVRVVYDVSFTGKSGLTTTYDATIPSSKHAPERLVKIINNLNNEKAGYATFLWEDTREVRPEGSKLYVFIRDTEKSAPASAMNTMHQYGITPVPWSQRDRFIGELSA